MDFQDALPAIRKGRRFRLSWPCGGEYLTLKEFSQCGSQYIMNVLQNGVDLEPDNKKKVMKYLFNIHDLNKNTFRISVERYRTELEARKAEVRSKCDLYMIPQSGELRDEDET